MDEPNPFRAPEENGARGRGTGWEPPGGAGAVPPPPAPPSAASSPPQGAAAGAVVPGEGAPGTGYAPLPHQRPYGAPPSVLNSPYAAPFPVLPPGPPRNGLGIASLILGVSAAALCWTFYLSPVAVVLGLPAVILGAAGAARARRGEATNRLPALGGLWTGAGAAAIGAVLSVLLMGSLLKVVDVTSEAGAELLAGAEVTVRYGDGLTVTMPEPELSTSGAVATVEIRLRNEGDGAAHLGGTELYVLVGDRELPDRDVRLETPLPGSLEPGQNWTARYTVTVPAGAHEFGLDFAPGRGYAFGYWQLPLPGAAGSGEDGDADRGGDRGRDDGDTADV
ncbi:hypothetical protein ACFV5N_25090 [Streptomyces sp. NPDC059853]|uniref:hypothetical protein n=1 Tax=Streptomyces sp. NPDC059853 TaxID=3346973 RepID=UPI00364D845A